MRLLVFSDSHRHVERMADAVSRLSPPPDAVIHLGDHIGDARALRAKLPGILGMPGILKMPSIPFYMVPGNCDFQDAGEPEQVVTLDGCRILITHGHLYGVKSGLDALIRRGKKVNAALALFGHTHNALVKQAGGLWLMNPGQLERDDTTRRATYGVVNIENGGFTCEIAELGG